MQTARDKGFEKEKEAVLFLKKQGYKILETNFCTNIGEIDIIANDDDDIVFVEVKYRKSLNGGTPQEAVTTSKQKKIINTALIYIKLKNIDKNIRFDVVAIGNDNIEVIKSAFIPPEGKYFF